MTSNTLIYFPYAPITVTGTGTIHAVVPVSSSAHQPATLPATSLPVMSHMTSTRGPVEAGLVGLSSTDHYIFHVYG